MPEVSKNKPFIYGVYGIIVVTLLGFFALVVRSTLWLINNSSAFSRRDTSRISFERLYGLLAPPGAEVDEK